MQKHKLIVSDPLNPTLSRRGGGLRDSSEVSSSRRRERSAAVFRFLIKMAGDCFVTLLPQ
jgi:hypothetical protein